MPTELEELVEFLHHGNTTIRQTAAEHLVGYSTAQPSLFKRNQLEPVRDLKLLVKDYAPIAKNALTILVNLSEDEEVLKSLADDDAYLESLLKRVTDEKEPNANEQCMLLANLGKSASIKKLLKTKRDVPKLLSTSPIAIDQLLDCFVKGSEGSYNKHADYDYLSYLFADIAKDEAGRNHFLTPRKEDEKIVPLTKLVVFTEHKSTIRRRGVANTIKNTAFNVHDHHRLLADQSDDGVGILPYLLLPLMGDEEYSDEDTEGMLDECQLLPPDKQREKEADIICAHLDTLLLLTTSKEGREKLRDVKVYPIVRELHMQVETEDVREGCDRLVQVLMRDEEGEGDDANGGAVVPKLQEIEEDEDEQIVDVL
ncbi:Protein hgh1 [Elasticomyces elasticus]|uniref:Protein HGH1 homolog n=1 Tax=Elasticomyces elasticus TaxID=574655 RepID=A0AAN7VQ40_9PEZI|nr:Protein hgh1 [Elasticomyces elasticus]KAK5715037.1 Protein hgh1 [Elasticomyces elasticus]